MIIGSETEPFAFVSSLTLGNELLRRSLFETGEELGRYVWVCEHPRCRPDLHRQEPLLIADTLIAWVRTARHFIVLLDSERHGAAITVNDRASAVSHFEIELFQAALLGKTVTVFVADGFSPGARLRALLDLLAWALPRAQWHGPLPSPEIRAAVRRLLLSSEPGAPAGGEHFALRRKLVARFHRARSAELRWLDAQWEARPSEPDLALVDDLLAQARASANQEHKLARLWLALRELMAVPPDERAPTSILTRWNDALGLWGPAAAWYGLHSHIYLGGLAALGSAAQLRAILRARRLTSALAANLLHPATALASATYSIAKLAPWSDRRRLLREALRHLENPAENLRLESDQHGLRGSILLRSGRPWQAAQEYRIALRLRERLGEPPARIGESLSELGFAFIFTSEWQLARECLATGTALLERHGSPGFAIRVLKKLAWLETLTLHRAAAAELRGRAASLAHRHAIFDQL